MKIVQWNIQSYNTNSEELKLLIHELGNPEVICLQETVLGHRPMYTPANYSAIQSRRFNEDDPERGVAIMINKGCHHEALQLENLGRVEAVAARVRLGYEWYTICSMYLSPNIRFSEDDISSVIAQLPEPFLLLGDMNAKHPTWGEYPSNNTGRIFDKLLEDGDFMLLNSETKTRLHIQNGTRTLIDLSIASARIAPDFTCTVDDEQQRGSDHYPIVIENPAVRVDRERPMKFVTERADWEEFGRNTQNYTAPAGESGVNEKVESITNFLIQAAKKAIPETGGLPGKVPVPWFDDECRRVHKLRKRAARKLRRRQTLENVVAYKRAKALCRWTFKKAKRESWKNYLSSINENTTPGEMWRKINKMRSRASAHKLPLLRDSNGEETDDPRETSGIFAGAYAAVSSEEGYTQNFRNIKNESERNIINFARGETRTEYNLRFTMEELADALSDVGDSAPGHDRITYSMISN